MPDGIPTGLTKHDSYRRMLGLSPVLSMRVSQLLAEGPRGGNSSEIHENLRLPDNSDIPSEKYVELTCDHVRQMLVNLRDVL